ncbi:MAG: hypothetical protein IJU41_03550 [Clostridia bacterium]|nr:hypothetical protein [Clostridia bacterium]
MTIRELSRLYYIRKEIDALLSVRAELLSRASAVTQTLSGLPRAPGRRDKVGDGAAALADLDHDLARLLEDYRAEARRLVDFIAACPDPHVRLCMELRFLRGYRWHRVAAVIGGGNSPEGCIMAVRRYRDRISDREKRLP